MKKIIEYICTFLIMISLDFIVDFVSFKLKIDSEFSARTSIIDSIEMGVIYFLGYLVYDKYLRAKKD
ncbi:MAG: hypothetical protein KGV57_04760 [Fusobacterium sp.]|nr:hypothetical protein [Fusobacterium sp.]